MKKKTYEYGFLFVLGRKLRGQEIHQVKPHVFPVPVHDSITVSENARSFAVIRSQESPRRKT